MGFFKDVKKLNQQSEAMRAGAPPLKDRLAAVSAQMAQMNAMATTTAGITTGSPATATIIAARQTGAMINFNPVVELELLVMMPSGVPMPATRQEMVMQIHLGRCQPGLRINVRVDPGDVNALWIDWVTPVM